MKGLKKDLFALYNRTKETINDSNLTNIEEGKTKILEAISGDIVLFDNLIQLKSIKAAEVP